MSEHEEKQLYENTFKSPPQVKRENRLFRLLMISLTAHAVFFAAAGAVGVAVYLKPDRVLAVDSQTGELMGQYRTTAYRTDEELLGASVKFATHFFSMNASTIIEDIQVSLNMMEHDLALKRREYIAKHNLVAKIKAAGARSWLEIKDDGKRIHSVKGRIARVEVKGNIIIDTKPDVEAKPRKDEKDVKITRSKVPFKLVLDCEMIPISDSNTSGVRILDYEERV